MGVPIAGIREDYSKDELQLYFPLMTTSPAIPQAGNSYLSNIELQNVSAKAIYLERGEMNNDPSWDGEKYNWTSGRTEIQTDFIDAGDNSSGNFNLLHNTAFITMQLTDWTTVFEKVSDNAMDWIYSKTAPTETTKIWVDTTKDSMEPQYWGEKGWENLYDYRATQLPKSSVKMIEQKSGNSFQIQKKEKGARVGVSQFFKFGLPIMTGTYINGSMAIEEKNNSGGMYIRLEFFDINKQILSTADSPRFFNRTESKKRFNFSFLYKNKDFKDAAYARVSYLAVDDREVYSAINKLKTEYGMEDTGWNLHEDEVSLDLNAGEIDMPMLDGLIDKSKVISEIAVLRSVLGEGLLKWEEVTRIKASTMQEAVLYDYFVENGNYYRYALQPILANGIKGAITTFYDMVSTFEGFWLLGENDMQFSFIYNGKIGTMTRRKPKDFIETIAGRFPYSVQASELDYYTFPFSGTLTYHQDVQHLLTAENYTTAISPDPTIPIGFVEIKYGDEMRLNMKNDLEEMQDGMVMQRAWRNKILDWLTDGKLKILKSEAQGNILVEVSNVKVTPVESLYGLVCDFECDMTQMGLVSEKTLQKYSLRKESLTKEDLLREAMNNSPL